jgi:hypothetical protein
MYCSPHDEHTGPPTQNQKNFVRPSQFFSFCLELQKYKNKFKNLILTSKFKFSFRGMVLFLSVIHVYIHVYGTLNPDRVGLNTDGIKSKTIAYMLLPCLRIKGIHRLTRNKDKVS